MTGFNNKLSCTLAASGFIAQSFLAPWCTRVFAHTMSSTVTTAMRVICGVHNNSTNRGADALTAIAPGFPNLDILMLFVTHAADVSTTLLANNPYFAAWQAQLCMRAFFSKKLYARAST